jgi:hypothetical protein
MVELAKHLFGQRFCPIYEGKAKSCFQVASLGIASLLLLGGRTVHSRFKIPIDLHDESTCNITQHMKVAELVRKANLIIWDEAPMMHRQAFEAIDRTLSDLMQLDDAHVTEKIFGGKTVVLGGDFRQILPIVFKGRQETLSMLHCFDRIFGSMLRFFVFISTCELWQPILNSIESLPNGC